MKLSLALSQSSSKHSQNNVSNHKVNLQQPNQTTPNKKYSFNLNKSKSSEKKILLTQLKHPFHSPIKEPQLNFKPQITKAISKNQAITISNQTPIKEIINSEKPLPDSPFNKGCFNSRSCRALLTVNQIKKNHHQNTSSTKYLTRSLQLNQKTSPKKPIVTSRQASTVLDSARSIQPTHYTSVKLFMSSKLKKGRKEKLPVNILAFSETIHEKQTTDSVLSTSCVRNLKFEQTVLVREDFPNLKWNSKFESKLQNVNA